MTDPYNPVDAEIRATAHRLLKTDHAALGTLLDGHPLVTRIGCLWHAEAGMLLLISDLSDHAKALAGETRCSLLVGEPGAKGDPLTHPRLTLMGRAEMCDKAAFRDTYLAARPKTGLYYDFTDFRLHALRPETALYNGGFGKAARLTMADLAADPAG
ncbi:MAG: pyridoxamine 5'-phosphate oxidase family protein [Pseudomonadota bacterium]